MLTTIWGHLSYFLKDFALYIILLFLAFIFLVIGSFKIYKSRFSQQRKNLLLSFVVTGFALIVVFSGFEAYFRYVYDDSDGLGYLKTNSRWLQRHVIFNSYFVRDRDFNPVKQKGVARIGVFGDSLAFGAGIKDPQNRFSNILEKELQQKGKKVEVYNLGRSGYDFEGETDWYKQVKNLDFDIIVWEYYPNDIQPEKGSTGSTIITSVTAPPAVKALSNLSFFFDFLYWRFSSQYQTTFNKLKNADLAQYKNKAVLEKHEQEIREFVKSVKSDKNKKFVVIIFPFAHLIGPNYPAGDVHKKMTEVFKKSGADAVIDLLPYLSNRKQQNITASRFDSHPNEKVHKLAADLLYTQIVKLIKK
jgi:hypothetical protein